MSPLRRISAAALLAATVAVLVGALASPAGAHALVRRSDPADGAILQSSPKQVVITFTERPDPKLSSMHVLNSAGRSVEQGQAQPVTGQPLELRVTLPHLPHDVYTVTWRVVSRADGHLTAGSFSFGVGTSPVGVKPPPGAGSSSSPSPSLLAVAGRWAFYWGLALVMGAAVVGTLIVRGLPARGRGLLVGAWIAAVAGLVAMALAERSTLGIGLSTLLRSGAGRTLLERAVALGAVGIAVAIALVRSKWTSLLPSGAIVAIAMVVHAMAGHAGAQPDPPLRAFDVVIQSLHLVAVGAWVGGLVWMLLAAREREGAERAAVVRRFSFMAGIALGAVAITGVVRASGELGGTHALSGLLHTSFGWTLAVKTGLFFGLVALGAYNRYVNVPGLERGTRSVSSLRLTIRGEVLLAAGILAATAVLSELPPASVLAAANAARAPAPQFVSVTGSDFATTVRVKLTATPGTVGPNAFQARITDFDTGRPVDASAVSMSFSLPGRPDLGTPTLDLSKAFAGTWSGQGTVLSMDGRWDVTILVQKPNEAVEVPLKLTTRLPPQQIQVQRAPGQPDIYTISLPAGNMLQTYIDPGTAGPNTVHFTFFKGNGQEQAIASATAAALTPAGVSSDLPLIRFDAGHFVANTTLTGGSWRFQIRATTGDGTVLSGYFTQQIG